MYRARFVQGFCEKCKSLGVTFAIFSDLHAFVFPAQKIEWYDKHPSEVLYNERAKNELFGKALSTLREFDIAYFYHLPENIRALHKLYAELVEHAARNGVRIVEITDLSQIERIAKKGSVDDTGD